MNFNPRPREEGDEIVDCAGIALNISIHALVKRATLFIFKGVYRLADFNPRPREEGDLSLK